jgi:hypothetical protein
MRVPAEGLTHVQQQCGLLCQMGSKGMGHFFVSGSSSFPFVFMYGRAPKEACHCMHAFCCAPQRRVDDLTTFTAFDLTTYTMAGATLLQ